MPRVPGTTECITCGKQFTPDNTCCCDEGNDGGCGPTGVVLHHDGECVRCCLHEPRRNSDTDS